MAAEANRFFTHRDKGRWFNPMSNILTDNLLILIRGLYPPTNHRPHQALTLDHEMLHKGISSKKKRNLFRFDQSADRIVVDCPRSIFDTHPCFENWVRV